MPADHKPLAGLRVLDLSRLLPGPYASLMLADMGAEVIKIEAPGGGDYIRYMPPHAGEHSALFAALNRGKQSVSLNLKHPKGRELFLRLAANADIVLESFRPGVLQRLGLDYETLAATNPRLILCSISGYGQAGPYRTRAGHDLNYIGLAGLLGVSGQTPDQPAFPGGQIADVGGGSLFATVAVLAALYERERTGRGRWIDTSMTDGVLGFITMHLAAHLAAPDQSTPGPGQMQLNGRYVCYNVYRTQDDRWVTLGALEPKFWENFCTAIAREDLRGKGFERAADDNATYRATVEEFAARPRDAWIALNEQHDFCCEPVLHFDEVAKHPLFSRHFFDLNGTQQIEVPLGLAGVSGREAAPPPALGQHTAEILDRYADLDADALTELQAQGVV